MNKVVDRSVKAIFLSIMTFAVILCGSLMSFAAPKDFRFTPDGDGTLRRSFSVIVSDYGSHVYTQYDYAWSKSATTQPTSWIKYTPSNNNPAVATIPSPPNTEGTIYLWIRGDIKSSNQYDYETSNAFLIDNKPPTIPTINFQNGYISGDWTNASVSGSISGSTDANNPLYQYQINSGTWQNGSAFAFTEEGSYTLYAQAIDEANNISAIANATIKIDKTAPAVPSITANPPKPAFGTITQNVTVTISYGSDTDVTPVNRQYRIKIGTTGTYNNWAQYTGPITVNANNTIIEARNVDNAGNISSGSYTVDYIASLVTFAPTSFSEATANNGTLANNTISLTLVNDTFTGSNGENYLANGKATLTNLPLGFTAALTRSSNTTATLTLTGTSPLHQEADGVTMRLAFNSSAFTTNVVAGDALKNIPVTFTDNPVLSFGTKVFVESSANNGTIATVIPVTLANGQFTDATYSSSHVVATGLPSGLVLSATRVDAHRVNLALTGTATSHVASNSVSGITISFLDAAFVGKTAAQVEKSSTSDWKVRFNNAPLLTRDPEGYSESLLNDGSIPTIRSILLSDSSFAPTLTAVSNYSITNLPSGLAANLVRQSDSRVSVQLTGNATNHAAANSTNLTVTFQSTAFSGTAPTALTVSIPIAFIDSKPIRVLEIYPSTINPGDGNIQDAKTRLIGSGYQVTSMTMHRFISLIDDINGQYDVVYFGNGNYVRDAADQNMFGNDVTSRAAIRVREFVNGGQLVIFHNAVNVAGTPNPGTTIIKTFYDSIITRANVKTISDASTLASTITTWMADSHANPRPILNMQTYPISYSSFGKAVDNKNLDFTFTASDFGSTTLGAILYIDKNNDSMFSTSEAVDMKVVNNGKTYTSSYTMPQDLSGIYAWKLEITDGNGAQADYTDVFRVKGDPATIKVLQVVPPSNTGDLPVLLTRTSPLHPGDTLGSAYGEYDIQITKVDIGAFNNPPAPDVNNLLNLNSNYNMIIFGFQDEYGSKDLDSDSNARLNSFIQTGQSVMFTHDTMEYDGYRTSIMLNDYLDDVGQIRSQLTATQITRNNTDATTISNYKLSTYNGYQPGDNIVLVKPVNSTSMSLYPYNLENTTSAAMKVANTHYQYYKLNLEDPLVVPVFNLYKTGADNRYVDDAMNLYYTYTRGNITYSGTGHTSTAGGYPDFELQLFVNTMMKAYAASNHAPIVEIDSPSDHSKVNTIEQDIPLTFRAYDHDFGDTILKYSVLIDPDNSGTFIPAKMRSGGVDVDWTNVNMTSGQTLSVIIPKKDAAGTTFTDIRTFRIKVVAKDSKGAESYQIRTLYNVETPMLTPELTTDSAAYLVGQSINAQLRLLPQGRVIVPETITPTSTTLYVPSGLSYLGDSDGATAVTTTGFPTYTFNEGGTSTGAVTANYTVATTSTAGKYTLSADVVYNQYGQVVRNQAPQQIDVYSGQVLFEVYDSYAAGNSMKNVTILEGGSIIGATGDGGTLLKTGISAGTHDYTVSIPSGYKLKSILVTKAISNGDTYEPFASGNTIAMSTSQYKWKVKAILELDITIPITYYQYISGKAPKQILVDDGTSSVTKSLSIAKNAKLIMIAKIQISDIGSTLVQGVQLMYETTRKDGSVVKITQTTDASIWSSTFDSMTPVTLSAADQKLVMVPGSVFANRNLWPADLKMATYFDLFNENTTTGFTYAGASKTYYAVMMLNQADGQKFRISSVQLKLDNGSKPEVYNSNISLVEVKELKPPVLK